MLTQPPPSVNVTETNYVLAMIAKAGVPLNKVVVGVSSYGRSFGMMDPSCRGPMCTYAGPTSGALSGSCTKARDTWWMPRLTI
jgi:GH18 family chitinase